MATGNITRLEGVWPETHERAVRDSAGVTLETKLGNINSNISQLNQEVTTDGVQKSLFKYSQFTPATPAISLGAGEELTMVMEGDYIELKVTATNSAYLIRRGTTSNQPCIRYSSQDYLQVRFNSSTNWTHQDAARIDFSKTQVIRVELVSIVDATYTYDIFIDGYKLGSQAVTNTTAFNQIGYGSVLGMQLYYIEAKLGGTVKRYTEFSKFSDAVGITEVYDYVDIPSLSQLDSKVASLDADMEVVKKIAVGSDMYFRFVKESTLSNVQSHFEISQRIKGNVYIRTNVGYYIYTGSAGHPNGYWRIERTNISTLVDGEWTNIKSQALTAGENEFVLQWLAGSSYNFASGFSGGFHYGEKIADLPDAWVEFVADGNRLGTDADIPLTPCKSFYYREYSAIYQHNDNTIAAWHLKETTFKDGGYETVNDVKFVQALDYFAYPGIACVSRWLSEKAMPEGVATITDMGDGTGSPHYDFQSNKHRIHYEGNGYICDVDSEVLIGADDSQCSLAVYNAADYNKYYRRNPDTVGSTSNRLKGRTKVKISAM